MHDSAAQPAAVAGRGPGAGVRLECRALSKRFGPVLANDRVSLTIAGGEIHALLGENGAGKSTLLNILAGMLQPDHGDILLDGASIAIPSPAAAIARGIGVVHQHFTLVDTLTVAENVALGERRGTLVDLAAIEARLGTLMAGFGLAISPRAEVGSLSLGERQRVEIVKALDRGSRVLLLDEPTSVLAPAEVAGLFALLRRLRDEGVAIVIVTHKLEEALDLCDRVTVLRRGRCVEAIGPDDLRSAGRARARERIVAAMFGGAIDSAGDGRAFVTSDSTALLALEGVSARDDRGAAALTDVTFALRAGEILGIAGVDGNGQQELAEVIAGQRPVAHGSVAIAGVALANRGARAARQAGIGYVTDDRMHEGIVAGLSLADNAALKAIADPPFARRRFLLDRGAMRQAAATMVRDFDVRAPGVDVPVGQLSGGNIQKLLLARELAANPRVLVCNKPTHGLDLKTTRFVHDTLRRHVAAGNAALVISTELDELLAVCDRIAVLYRGRIVGEVARAGADPVAIGRLMIGGGAS